jgi:hypothetical protein
VASPSPAQWVRAPCGWPDGTCVHVPTWPATSHAWHWPSQPVSQHTPSTQKPERHSPAAPHASAFCLRTARSPARSGGGASTAIGPSVATGASTAASTGTPSSTMHRPARHTSPLGHAPSSEHAILPLW